MTAELGLAIALLVAVTAILYEVVENLRWRGAAARSRSSSRPVQWFREAVDRSAGMLFLRSISGRAADHPAPNRRAIGQEGAAVRRSMAHPLTRPLLRVRSASSRAGVAPGGISARVGAGAHVGRAEPPSEALPRHRRRPARSRRAAAVRLERLAWRRRPGRSPERDWDTSFRTGDRSSIRGRVARADPHPRADAKARIARCDPEPGCRRRLGHHFVRRDRQSPLDVDRRLTFSRGWSAGGPHVLRIEVVGTAGGPRVDVDAFVVLR